MDKEKLIKIIEDLVGSEEAGPAGDPVSIVYQRDQDEDYSLRLEMNGGRNGIFTAICEITSVWAVTFRPEEREDQVRLIADACINALKQEDYVNALKHYLKIR